MSRLWPLPPGSDPPARMRWARRLLRVSGAMFIPALVVGAAFADIPWYLAVFIAVSLALADISLGRATREVEQSVAEHGFPGARTRRRRVALMLLFLLVYTGVGLALFLAFGFLAFLAYSAGNWIVLELVSIVVRRRRS